jgi:hypothetical protein
MEKIPEFVKTLLVSGASLTACSGAIYTLQLASASPLVIIGFSALTIGAFTFGMTASIIQYSKWLRE